MDMLRNADAEIAVIGAALNSKTCAATVADLPADYFSVLETKAAHAAICRMVSTGQPVDMITLEAEARAECATVGTMLIRAQMDGYTTAMMGQWVAILDDASRRRAIYRAAQQAMQDATDPGKLPAAIAESMAAQARTQETTQTTVSMADAMASLMDTFGAKRKSCQTGIADLDRLTGGFRGGKLVVLGARPGVGKTALALSIAKHVAQHTGPVLLVCLEMDAVEIVARIYASISGVDVQELESGNLSGESLDSLATYVPDTINLPIRVAERASTPMQVRREAQRMKENGGLEMIVVDYIQLMHPDGKHSSRYEEVSEISRELKLLAMELGVPVLALTQFNRASEGKYGMAKRAPSMAEAKDSGSIEQDANVFITQYEPDEVSDDPYLSHAKQVCDVYGWHMQQLIVEKNRQGRTGKIVVGFDKPHMTFQNIDFSGVRV